MHTPRTIATVVSADQAQSILEHIQGALDVGAPTVFLYTTLDEVMDSPQSFSDFPAPDVYIFETVYVIGMDVEAEDLQAQVAEHSDKVDK